MTEIERRNECIKKRDELIENAKRTMKRCKEIHEQSQFIKKMLAEMHALGEKIELEKRMVVK